MESENEQLDLIFLALSDQLRRDILHHLSESPQTIGELAKTFGVSLSSLSKNMSMMERANLVYKTKQGRQVFCHLNFDIWSEVMEYVSMMAFFWKRRLNNLEKYLEEE